MNLFVISTITLLVSIMFSATARGQLDDATIRLIETEIESGNFIGVMVAIAEGDTILYQGFGQSSKDSNTRPDEHTVFEIGSVTKTFTATLLAQMVQDGRVTLDEAVQDMLPDGINLAQLGERPITLGDLAEHRSGLPGMPADFAPQNPMNPYAGITVDDLWQTVNTMTPTNEPGVRYEYSNVGYAVLGQVLARRAGMSYEDLVRQSILEPLAMHNSELSMTDRLRPFAATGYSQDGVATPYWQLDGGYAPAGAINSTAADILQYLKANLGVSGPTPLQNAMRLTHALRQPMEGTNLRIGLGWISMPLGTGRWHNGGTYGFHSFAAFRPDTGRAVVLWANSFAPDDGIDTIGMHLLNSEIPLPPARSERVVREEVSLSHPQLEQYVGRYLMDFGATLTLTLDNGQLLAQLTNQPAVPVFAEAADQFFFRIVDAQIEFRRNNNGEITAVVLKQGGQEMGGERQ